MIPQMSHRSDVRRPNRPGPLAPGGNTHAEAPTPLARAPLLDFLGHPKHTADTARVGREARVAGDDRAVRRLAVHRPVARPAAPVLLHWRGEGEVNEPHPPEADIPRQPTSWVGTITRGGF